eukprot:4611289-Prymnesium_polylepis.1
MQTRLYSSRVATCAPSRHRAASGDAGPKNAAKRAAASSKLREAAATSPDASSATAIFSVSVATSGCA